MTRWYEPPSPPVGDFWWAVEHRGHPAFYLRALMPGDFAPGQAGPLPRHVGGLDGRRLDVVLCETCGEAPDPADLVPFERRTHDRGFLDPYRARRRWPAPTPETSCWFCSNPRAPIAAEVDGHPACAACAAHLKKRG